MPKSKSTAPAPQTIKGMLADLLARVERIETRAASPAQAVVTPAEQNGFIAFLAGNHERDMAAGKRVACAVKGCKRTFSAERSTAIAGVGIVCKHHWQARSR